MSDEDALRAAIAAHPDEDTPRLAYADWLDEHADDAPDPELSRVRAEFIRVQVERHRCPYWLADQLARYRELSQCERVIQDRYTAAILGIAAGTSEVWFSRGFPCLRMSAGTFLAHAQRFEQLRPPVLTVTDVREQWYDLITHPHLPLITNLTMNSRSGQPGPWAVDAAVLGRLGELGRHNRLRGLDLRACHVGDTGLVHLAEHADVWRLEELDLSHNDIQYSGLMEVLLTSIPDTLRRVNLCGNPITDLGAKALAKRWPANEPLKWLRLEGTQISPAGRALLRARFGEKVEFAPDV